MSFGGFCDWPWQHASVSASCQDATYFCQTYKEDYCDYTSVTSPENSLSWELNCKVDGVENCSRHDSSEFDANAFGCAVAVNLTGGDSWNVEASGCITHTEPRESPRKVCSLQPVERPTDGLYYCSCRGDFCNKYVIVSFEPTVPSSTLTSQASQGQSFTLCVHSFVDHVKPRLYPLPLFVRNPCPLSQYPLIPIPVF